MVASESGAGKVIEVQWKNAEGQIVKDTVRISTTASAFALERSIDNAVTKTWQAGAGLEGQVIQVDPINNEIDIVLGENVEAPLDLVGKVIHFENDLRRTSHTITGAYQKENTLIINVRDDLQVGHLKVAAVTPTGLTTATGLAFAPVYAGTYLADGALNNVQAIQGVEKGVVNFITPHAQSALFEAGQDVWVLDVGPGDRVTLPLVH